jgi:hypothetical protein
VHSFNETEWLRLVFLLADTQLWVDGLCRDAFMQLPVDKKKLFKKDYCLTITAMAHILERHYYKVNRHPQAGKFHIPVTDILEYIRSAYAAEPSPINNSCNSCRVLDTGAEIGFDNNGNPATCITVITDRGGRIVTAFPSSSTGTGEK